MNTRNDWENLLNLANEELGKKGYALNIFKDEEWYYSCDILKDGKVIENYAEGFYENELSELITDAWHYVIANFI